MAWRVFRQILLFAQNRLRFVSHLICCCFPYRLAKEMAESISSDALLVSCSFSADAQELIC
jgi:hypothetical protein